MAQRQNKARTESVSTAQVRFDNHLRQTLGIPDPRDSTQFVESLWRRYGSQKQLIDLEEAGLPYVKELTIEETVEGRTKASDEVTRALRHVDRDLDSLVGDAALKDIQEELMGWSVAIHKLCRRGLKAAEYGADPSKRGRALLARMSLMDYSRAARNVGTLSPGATRQYRELARSLDTVSNLILVRLGETLASSNGHSTRFLVQAAAEDVRARGQAVVAAYENLQSAAAEHYHTTEYNRGLCSLLQISEELNATGQTDMRALLSDNVLAEVVEEMMDAVIAGDATSLRGLSATSTFGMQPLRRLATVTRQATEPQSPPAAAFVTALHYFLEAFDNSANGTRLQFIARPAVMLGSFGARSLDFETVKLLPLILHRSRLLELADCYLDCNCADDDIAIQYVLDKLVYDADRAVTLLAMSSPLERIDEPILRAYGLGAVFATARRVPYENDQISDVIKSISALLGWGPNAQPSGREQMHDEVCMQYRAEAHWEQVIERLSPGCRHNAIYVDWDGGSAKPVIAWLLDEALALIEGCSSMTLVSGFNSFYTQCVDDDPLCPDHIDVSTHRVADNTGRIADSEYDDRFDYDKRIKRRARRPRQAQAAAEPQASAQNDKQAAKRTAKKAKKRRKK